MDWFSDSNAYLPFKMMSASHITALLVFSIGCYAIYKNRDGLRLIDNRLAELSAAAVLILFEAAYHIWLWQSGFWKASESIPAELCSISLFLSILLLLTGRKVFYEWLFFTALLGATQALLTPVLYIDFPHFRFVHFFFTHMMMIWTALYYTWVKGWKPTGKSILKTFVFLNLLLPGVIYLNKATGGNYMFLSRKPETASLLDYLGPHPLYILSLEALFLAFSVLLWLVFRSRTPEKEHG